MPVKLSVNALSAIMVLIAATGAGAVTRMPVFVSIAPQRYFVEKIGGDLVKIHTMVSPGASPATYEPKPRQMAALAKAKVYFAIGVPFENRWLQKIVATNPLMEVIHTDHGIAKPAQTARGIVHKLKHQLQTLSLQVLIIVFKQMLAKTV